MTGDPYEALRTLRSSAARGELGAMCVRHGVELLVAHGSVLDAHPLRPAADLDLAYRHKAGSRQDRVALVNELLELTRFDRLDLMDLSRAGPVARARALGPCSLPLYEVGRGTFAENQMAALTEEMETRWLRRLDLELLADK